MNNIISMRKRVAVIIAVLVVLQSAALILVLRASKEFYVQEWTLAGMVQQGIFHGKIDGAGLVVALSMFAALAIMLMLVFISSHSSTASILLRPKWVHRILHNKANHTEANVIDDLTNALAQLNRRVQDAEQTTSRMLELTLLPIGGFEVSENSDYVTVTEFIYSFLQLNPEKNISVKEWRKLYAKMVEYPVAEYENVYKFGGENKEENRWLKIVTSSSDGVELGVILDVTKDVEEHHRLASELDNDTLTHLYNRVAFNREACQRIKENPNAVGAMIFSDLDNLKYMNDTFGHDMGDKLIVCAGEMFREFEKYGGVVSRISGDEFAVYIHGFDSVEECRELINRQMDENMTSGLDMPDGSFQRVRFSSGVAWYPDDSDNITDLLKLSDFAMYEAKHSNKGNSFEFDRENYREKAYLFENREAINKFLDEELIDFAYQPIVDLRTGEVYAYEMLMRSQIESLKSPAEIIEVATAQSKLERLEMMVIMNALRHVNELATTHKKVKFFINSIPTKQISDKDYDYIEQNYAHIFDRVVIELTERENDSPAHMHDKVSFIRKVGASVAVDDFGSGYSNELRVLSMNPDIIKIDIDLIRGICRDLDKRQLVQNIISFCSPRGIRIVAEGVESFDDLSTLVEMKIDYVQGFYLGRPEYELREISEPVRKQIQDLNKKAG